MHAPNKINTSSLKNSVKLSLYTFLAIQKRSKNFLKNSSFHWQASNKSFHMSVAGPKIKAVRARANFTCCNIRHPYKYSFFHSPFFLWKWPNLERLREQISDGHDYQRSDIKYRRSSLPLPYFNTQNKALRSPISNYVLNFQTVVLLSSGLLETKNYIL